MDLSLDSGGFPAKAFLVQAVLCSFQQREGYFYIPSSLIVDCHFFPSLNTMRLQSEFAAEAWYCQFSSGTKGCKHKGREASQPNLELCGTRRATVRKAEMLQNSPLPPIQIHFNGKFVVKCPPQND